jgi:dipeptide/tripeptide permease
MANAVSPTCGTVAAMTGAGAAYGLRMLLGAGQNADATVLAVAAIGYVASAALATRMSRGLLGPSVGAPLSWHSFTSAGKDVLQDLSAGARHIRERPKAFHALAVIGVHRIGYGIMTITLALLCRNYFSDPTDVDAGIALLAKAISATGAGVALAAFVTPLAASRIGPWRWIATCITGAAVAEALFVINLGGLGLLYVGAFVIGLTGQGTKICVDAVVQGSVDDEFRGRVFSLYDVVFNAAFVLAAVICVLVLPRDGFSRGVFAAVGVLFASAAIAYTLTERRQHKPEVNHPAPRDLSKAT